MALAPSLFSYTKIKKIIEILLINKKKTTYTFPKHELLTIVVDPSFRGKMLQKIYFFLYVSILKKLM